MKIKSNFYSFDNMLCLYKSRMNNYKVNQIILICIDLLLENKNEKDTIDLII